jgi:hypothetical protein
MLRLVDETSAVLLINHFKFSYKAAFILEELFREGIN